MNWLLYHDIKTNTVLRHEIAQARNLGKSKFLIIPIDEWTSNLYITYFHKTFTMLL